MTLTDRFEVVKDIGDGSFGNVVLAKVRSAGSHIARRGTLVRSFYLIIDYPQQADEYVFSPTGSDQNHEEKIRIVPTMPRASGGHLP